MAGRGYMDPALAGVPQWQTLMHTPLPAAASVAFRLVFINEPMLELLHCEPDALLGPEGWMPVSVRTSKELKRKREYGKGKIHIRYALPKIPNRPLAAL